MHKLESVLEKETHKRLWYFEMQTDPRIPARREDIELRRKEHVTQWILLFQPTTEEKWNKKKNGQIVGSCQS